MLENYDFIGDDVMPYFKRRLTQAPDDADFALDYVKRNARTPRGAGRRARCAELQVQRAVGAARRAASRLCRAGRLIPPGAFVPGQNDERATSPDA